MYIHIREDKNDSAQYRLYFQKLDRYVRTRAHTAQRECFLRLGAYVVRVIYDDPAFWGHIQKQLYFCIHDQTTSWDATVFLWHEERPEAAAEYVLKPKAGEPGPDALLAKSIDTQETPEMSASAPNGASITVCDDFIRAADVYNNVYYCGVRDLMPEAFLKHGHMLVQLFGTMLNQRRDSALVHAAAVGLNGNGILLCARGQRGKSTLAVTAMLQGMEYVADDYLVLEQNKAPDPGKSELFASPIYSVIALSPVMYNALYDQLDAKFVANNALQSKYILNINGHGDAVRYRYPIRTGMFPNITNAPEPSIEPFPQGQAVAQMVHSTITQMNQHRDTGAIRKLIHFVAPLDFYRINLCPDIRLNAECLRRFAEKLHRSAADL